MNDLAFTETGAGLSGPPDRSLNWPRRLQVTNRRTFGKGQAESRTLRQPRWIPDTKRIVIQISAVARNFPKKDRPGGHPNGQTALSKLSTPQRAIMSSNDPKRRHDCPYDPIPQKVSPRICDSTLEVCGLRSILPAVQRASLDKDYARPRREQLGQSILDHLKWSTTA